MEPHSPRKKPEAPVKRRCHRCHGSGRAPCEFCAARGEVVRGKDRLGKPLMTRCEGCFGLKTRRCVLCNGEGFL